MRHFFTILFAVSICAFAAFVASSCASNSPYPKAGSSNIDYRFEIANQNPFSKRAGNAYELDIAGKGNEVAVMLFANNESDTGHLLHIVYPSELLSPVSVDFSREFGGEGYVTLAVTKVPGIVAIGVSPIGGGRAPAGKIATLRFNPGTFSVREVSTAPSGTENAVNDLKVEQIANGEVRLTWHGKLKGDFDLSGEVGIPDITPIALHYLETTESTEDIDLFRIIDGDGSGEIGIPDVTVIALHYLETLVGYRAYRGIPQDPPIPGGPVNWLSIPLNISDGADASLAERPLERHLQEGFLFFEVTSQLDSAILDVPSAWRVVPTDGESEGVPGQAVLLIPEINHLAKVPPLSKTRIGTVDVTSADIVVSPGKGDPAPFENGAPLIAYRTSNGGLILAYYLDGWQEQLILDDGRTFTSPDIEIINGVIVIAIADRTNNEIKIFAGLPGEAFDEFSTTGTLPSAPSMLRLDYSEQDGSLLLAFTQDAISGNSKLIFATAPTGEDFGSLNWVQQELHSAPVIAGMDLCVKGDSGEIAIAFSAGTSDSQNLTANTSLFQATKPPSGGNFDIQDITVQANNALPLFVSCDYVDGSLEIVYQHLRILSLPFVGEVPVLDIRAYKGGVSALNTTLVGGSVQIVNLITMTVAIKFAIEPAIVSLSGAAPKSAFVSASSASGQLSFAAFPAISGNVQLGIETTTQSGATFSPLNNRGAGRGINTAYSTQLGFVEACYIETQPLDVTTIGGLQNLPAGPLYFITYSP